MGKWRRPNQRLSELGALLALSVFVAFAGTAVEVESPSQERDSRACEEVASLADDENADSLLMLKTFRKCMESVGTLGKECETAYDANQKAIDVYVPSFKASYNGLWIVAHFLEDHFNPTFKQKHDVLIKWLDYKVDQNIEFLQNHWMLDQPPGVANVEKPTVAEDGPDGEFAAEFKELRKEKEVEEERAESGDFASAAAKDPDQDMTEYGMTREEEAEAQGEDERQAAEAADRLGRPKALLGGTQAARKKLLEEEALQAKLKREQHAERLEQAAVQADQELLQEWVNIPGLYELRALPLRDQQEHVQHFASTLGARTVQVAGIHFDDQTATGRALLRFEYHDDMAMFFHHFQIQLDQQAWQAMHAMQLEQERRAAGANSDADVPNATQAMQLEHGAETPEARTPAEGEEDAHKALFLNYCANAPDSDARRESACSEGSVLRTGLRINSVTPDEDATFKEALLANVAVLAPLGEEVLSEEAKFKLLPELEESCSEEALKKAESEHKLRVLQFPNLPATQMLDDEEKQDAVDAELEEYDKATRECSESKLLREEALKLLEGAKTKYLQEARRQIKAARDYEEFHPGYLEKYIKSEDGMTEAQLAFLSEHIPDEVKKEEEEAEATPNIPHAPEVPKAELEAAEQKLADLEKQMKDLESQNTKESNVGKKATGLKKSLEMKAQELRKIKGERDQLLQEKEENDKMSKEKADHAAHEAAVTDKILVRMTEYTDNTPTGSLALSASNAVSHSKALFQVDRQYCGCQQSTTPDKNSRTVTAGQCGTLDNWQQAPPQNQSASGTQNAQLREPTDPGKQIPVVFASLIDKPASSTRKALVVITGKWVLPDEQCKLAGLSPLCCVYTAQPFTASGSEFSLEASELALKEMWFFQKNQDTYSQKATRLFQLLGPKAKPK